MKKNLAYRILNLFGWKLNAEVAIPPKCVICVAPHTSNWDFILGILARRALGVRASFFIKHEWFRFPLGGMMRRLGGIPIHRDRKTNLTDIIAEEFSHRDQLIIALTPEGTRSYNPEWKKGFYFIAHKAQVPILLASLDYKKREITLGRLFLTTDNHEADIAEIKSFYKNVTAKYPQKFGI